LQDKEDAMSVKSHASVAALIALGLLASACGNNPTDRALTGGAIGAGSGAVIGSTVGAPIAGAVIGGATGAVVGAATTPPPREYRDY
jgi:osmotically inducible lipoprotein OsmB